MAENKQDKMDLKLDMDKLRSLSKELRIQTDSTVNQLNMLEHKLLESTLSLRSSEREPARVKQIEEISKQMGKLHATLDPLNKRRALVEALLDPSTMFWLSLRMGDHKQMVEEAIADILERDLECEQTEETEETDDTEGKEASDGHDPKPAATPETGQAQEQAEVHDQTEKKKAEEKPHHKPRRLPDSGGGAFDDFLD